MYLIKFLLTVIISYFIITQFNLVEKFNDIANQSGNNNLRRFPKCLLKSNLGLRLFYLLEKHGKLEQTVLPHVYDQILCLTDEINKTKSCNQTIKDKYFKALKETGYSHESNDIINLASHIIDQESKKLVLHPDDEYELIQINNLFRAQYLDDNSLIKNLC